MPLQKQKQKKRGMTQKQKQSLTVNVITNRVKRAPRTQVQSAGSTSQKLDTAIQLLATRPQYVQATTAQPNIFHIPQLPTKPYLQEYLNQYTTLANLKPLTLEPIGLNAVALENKEERQGRPLSREEQDGSLVRNPSEEPPRGRYSVGSSSSSEPLPFISDEILLESEQAKAKENKKQEEKYRREYKKSVGKGSNLGNKEDLQRYENWKKGRGY